jgi:hypothetical protein
MHRHLLCGVLCLSLAVLGAGCGDTEELPPPTDPTPTEITEPPFTGTLTINGGVTQPFNTTGPGTVTAVISSLQPSTNVGVALGTWNGTSCQLREGLFNDNAGVGGGVAGLANAAGSLCVRVYDVGQLTGPVTFSVTIKHF